MTIYRPYLHKIVHRLLKTLVKTTQNIKILSRFAKHKRKFEVIAN